MMIAEPTLGQVNFLSVECCDCGFSRWRKPSHYYSEKITSRTPLSVLGSKLKCPACRTEGYPGNNISIDVAWNLDADRRQAEAWRLKNPSVREAG